MKPLVFCFFEVGEAMWQESWRLCNWTAAETPFGRPWTFALNVVDVRSYRRAWGKALNPESENLSCTRQVNKLLFAIPWTERQTFYIFLLLYETRQTHCRTQETNWKYSVRLTDLFSISHFCLHGLTATFVWSFAVFCYFNQLLNLIFSLSFSDCNLGFGQGDNSA